MTTFRRVRIEHYIDDIDALLRANWERMGKGFGFPLDIDREAYKRAEQAGIAHAIMAFDQVGKPIGYCVFNVLTHFLSRNHKIANSDTIYIDPEHQDPLIGGLLMRAVRLAAKELGANQIYWHALAGTMFETLLGAHDRMKLAELVFMEDL